MKICFLVPDLDTNGGWGRYAAELVTYAKQVGHEVGVLVENSHTEGSKPILRRDKGMLGSVFATHKYIKDYDIIYALDVYPHGIIAYLASIGLKKKLILGALGTYAIAPLHSWRTGWLAKTIYRRADVIVAISEYTKKQILNSVPDVHIRVINPGIDLKKFLKPHFNSGEEFIIGVGALKYRKGYHISIPAFAKVANEYPQLRYKVIGRQSDRNYFKLLQSLVKQYGVQGRAEFIEGISDDNLLKLYQQARAFILTSVNHNFH